MRFPVLASLLLGCCACGPVEGQFKVLTYNVAGLPEGISSSNPERNHLKISPRLNDYELVLAQEDFHYHERLAVAAAHPYQSVPKPSDLQKGIGLKVSDGLNRFSEFEFGQLHREQWEECHGFLEGASDCISEKGFSVAEHILPGGLKVNIYNFHMEAGGSPEDNAARATQITQLLQDIDKRPGALILGGDTNLKEADPEDLPLLKRLIKEAGLTDVCTALECGKDHIDRIMFRNSDKLKFTPVLWKVDRQFVDDLGEDLSDHPAIAAEFRYEG